MSNRRTTFRTHAICAGLALCALAPPATSHAANLQPAGINLGATSFFDGFGRNEEGFTYLVYLQYGMADRINDDKGKALPYFNDPHINAFALINQLVYVLPEPLFGDRAHLGIDFLLPVVAFDTSFDPPPPAPGFQLKDNGIGLGDLTFGPLLQFRPVMLNGHPFFSHRVEVDFIVPTGKFDPYKDLNQGSNFTSINPYWAMTLLPFPHFELSARFHYLYNFKTDKPALGYLYGLTNPPPVKNAQAGQAVWVNFAASYELPARLHWGVNGYFFQQLNLDRWTMNTGAVQSGGAMENEYNLNDTGKASIFGIGPGVFFDAGEHDKLFANVYFQLMAHNRPQGNTFNLHWIHGF
jgi:hypothetical protein